jgi:hypothetical protein
VDSADALPTSPQAQQQQQRMTGTILMAAALGIGYAKKGILPSG